MRRVGHLARSALHIEKTAMGTWIPISERLPPDTISRVLVVRQVADGNRYVDVIVFVNESDSGLPPLPSSVGVTHWMPLPELP